MKKVLLIACLLMLVGCEKKDSSIINNKNEKINIQETTEKTEYKELREDMLISDDVMIPYKVKISGTSDEGIAVYWKEPENVDGYVVYRSYKKKKGYKIIDILGNTPYFTTYYDNTFNHDAKKVYYKVRSYREEDGVKIYSRFSKVMTAKYKENLKLSKHRIYMFSDTDKQINAYIGWGNAKNVTWSSSDESIATVSSEGVITALSKGEAVITCAVKTEDDNDITKDVYVTVDREDVDKLTDTIIHRYVRDDSGIYKNPDSTDTLNEAKIIMVGDLMAMGPTIRACKGDDGIYNFNSCYDYVKPLIEKSDLALGNLETVIASEYSYSTEEGIVDSWPQANAPATFLDALAYAGFDGFPMSNNHNADCGIKGVISTIDTLNDYGFPYTGIQDGSDEDRYIIYEVNGINVGVIAYTTKECGFNTKEESWDESDVEKYLNYYSKDKAISDIKDMKEAGAEFCIVYMHWGIKNYFEPTENQYQVALELANIGFDYIAGAHSHTVQKYEKIKTDDNREVPCIYSMGDFNAHINQIPGNRDAVMMCVNIRRNDDGVVGIADDYYIPYYTYDRINDKPYVSMPLLKPLYKDYYKDDNTVKLSELVLDYNYRDLSKSGKYQERIINEIGKDISPLIFK